MDIKDIYPNLAVWIREATHTWPAVVTTMVDHSIHPTNYPETGCWVRMDFEAIYRMNPTPNYRTYGEQFTFMEYIEPRNPNNPDEVPPEPFYTPTYEDN